MEDLMIVIVGTITAVIGAYIVISICDWYRQKLLIIRYSKVLFFELSELKIELDKIIKDYEHLNKLTRDELGLTKEQYKLVPGFDPQKFLLRWNLKYKYTFLRENFEKISIFNSDLIKSIIYIYSVLEEFEDYKQQSINDLTATNKTLEEMGMGNAELLLIGNLKKAQNEIPKTLALLNLDKSINPTKTTLESDGNVADNNNNKEILIEIRDILLNKKNDDENSNITVLIISIFSIFVAWVALSIVYLQSLSSIEFTINQTSNQTTWDQMFVTSPLQMQQNNLVQMMNLQYAIIVIGAAIWILGFILAGILIYKAIRAIKKRYNFS